MYGSPRPGDNIKAVLGLLLRGKEVDYQSVRREADRLRRKREGGDARSREEVVVGQLGRAALPSSALAEVSRQAARRWGSQRGRDRWIDEGTGLEVQVKNGYDTASDRYTTDILVIDPMVRDGSHFHAVYDEDGRAIIEELRRH